MLIVLCVWVTGFSLLMLAKPKGMSAAAVVIMFITWPAVCLYTGITLLLEDRRANRNKRKRSQKDDK